MRECYSERSGFSWEAMAVLGLGFDLPALLPDLVD